MAGKALRQLGRAIKNAQVRPQNGWPQVTPKIHRYPPAFDIGKPDLIQSSNGQKVSSSDRGD